MKRIARRLAAIGVVALAATLVTVAEAGPASASCNGVGDTYHCVWKNGNYGLNGGRDMRYYGWNEDDIDYTDTHWNYPVWSAFTINDQPSSLENDFAGCYNTYYQHIGYGGFQLGASPGTHWVYLNGWNDAISSSYAAC